MKLIVGLGNVGDQYKNTRHNIGFMVVDELANGMSAKWKVESKLRADVAVGETNTERIIFAKPRTMMNLSGESIQKIMRFYKIDPSNLWLVFDDVDVPFGRLRIRQSGSSGGHQGVRSTIQHVGTEFVRVRVGISLNDRTTEPSEVYVLKPFNSGEREKLPDLISSAATVIEQQLAQDTTDESTFSVLDVSPNKP